jgi:hypothetical protein
MGNLTQAPAVPVPHLSAREWDDLTPNPSPTGEGSTIVER